MQKEECDDNLIDYCPEVEIFGNMEYNSCVYVNNALDKAQLLPQVVVYVCSLCFRQYELKEDLRGHYIEVHKYKPVNPSVAEQQVTSTTEDPKYKSRKNCLSISSMKMESMPTSTVTTFVPSKPEIRPVPFKDFRTSLRSKLTRRCSVFLSCAYKFETEAKQEVHAKCHLSNATSQQFNCFECGLKSSSWRCCSVHLWKAHQIDVDLLQCPICAFKSHASALVWRHMRIHKKWRPRVLRSIRVSKRRRQKQQQQDGQKPTEEKLPQVSNKNKYYAEKICEICGRRFVNGKTLSKHVKTVHNKIKPFICNVCGRKTARKASLIIHMRQHTGEKPLLCKICKFATRDPSVLHKHKLRHEKAGKFKCELCGYTCIQTNAYKRHMRLNHAAAYGKIACDLCPFVTISEQKLKTHKQDHRKGLIVSLEDSMDATRAGSKRKLLDENNEISADCFMPLESIDSLPHEPAVDTGGVTIPAPSEDTQFPTYLNN